jgi:homoserine O-acetyltransferase
MTMPAFLPRSAPHRIRFAAPLALASGAVLPAWEAAYESWGRLDAAGGNAVLVLHSLTSDCHAAAGAASGAGWWDALIGPGRAIDTDRYFVICPNALGGCHGASGPSSQEPDGARRYGMRFPVVTVPDIATAHRHLLHHLGVRRLALVIGGCLGGLGALVWGTAHADMTDRVVAISARAASSTYSIALWDVLRRAIRSDPAWRGGDYYDSRPPSAGMALATLIGALHWMEPAGLQRKYARRRSGPARFGFAPEFEVEHAFAAMAARAGSRFDANTLLYLTRAIDYFDLDISPAALRGAAPHLLIGYERDIRYPPEESAALAAAFGAAGVAATCLTLRSAIAHGAFLLDPVPLAAPISAFLNDDNPG